MGPETLNRDILKTRFSLRILFWRSYEAEIWPSCGVNGGKKVVCRDFEFFADFQNGGHFCKKVVNFRGFSRKKGRHFENWRKIQNPSSNFFATIYATTWPNFSLIAHPEQNPLRKACFQDIAILSLGTYFS